MAVTRGQSGSMTFDGSAVAQLVSWALNTDLEELDTTVMGEDWKTNVGGQGAWRGSAQVRLDLLDAGQAAIADELIVASPAGLPLALVLRARTGQQFSGNALVRSAQIQHQLGQVITLQVEFTGSGALARSWA